MSVLITANLSIWGTQHNTTGEVKGILKVQKKKILKEIKQKLKRFQIPDEPKWQ